MVKFWKLFLYIILYPISNNDPLIILNSKHKFNTIIIISQAVLFYIFYCVHACACARTCVHACACVSVAIYLKFRSFRYFICTWITWRNHYLYNFLAHVNVAAGSFSSVSNDQIKITSAYSIATVSKDGTQIAASADANPVIPGNKAMVGDHITQQVHKGINYTLYLLMGSMWTKTFEIPM